MMMQLSLDDIMRLVPQQPPFLFVEKATLDADGAVGTYKIRGDEDFLRGHFKHRPVFPGSLMVEAVGQLAVAHLTATGGGLGKGIIDAETIVFASCDSVRCRRICEPGDELTLTIRQLRFRPPMAVFSGEIRVGEELAARVGSFALAFRLNESHA